MLTALTILAVALVVGGLTGLGWLIAAVVLDAPAMTPDERDHFEQEWRRHVGAMGELP
jgi:hypothetical protein